MVVFGFSRSSSFVGSNDVTTTFTAVTHNIRIRVMLEINAWPSMPCLDREGESKESYTIVHGFEHSSGPGIAFNHLNNPTRLQYC